MRAPPLLHLRQTKTSCLDNSTRRQTIIQLAAVGARCITSPITRRAGSQMCTGVRQGHDMIDTGAGILASLPARSANSARRCRLGRLSFPKLWPLPRRRCQAESAAGAATLPSGV